jgi:hypothetical protein
MSGKFSASRPGRARQRFARYIKKIHLGKIVLDLNYELAGGGEDAWVHGF